MGSRKWLLPCSVVLSAINGLLSLVPFVFLWLVVDTLLKTNGDFSAAPIWDYAIAAFAFAVANILLYFIALMLSHLAAFRLEVNMRKEAIKSLLNAPLGYLEQFNTGKIRKVIDEDTLQTHTLVAHLLPDIAGSIVAPIGVIIILFTLNWLLGIVAMVPIIVAVGILVKLMTSENQSFQRLYMDAQEKMSSEAVEYVRGIPIVKVFQQTIYSFKRFYNSIISYRDLATKYVMLWRTPFPIYTVVINSFAFILVPATILLIEYGNKPIAVISDLILYILIAPVIAGNIMRIMHLGEDLFVANETVERLEKLTKISPLSISEYTQSPKNYNIELKNISFKYDGSKQNVLNSISLSIKEGTTVALVGPSGSGKTTIARLIPRFWDPTQGQVTIGGIDVKSIKKTELMDKISFVFHNARLFKTTILDNVCYGSPNATIEEINRAIDLSQSREIIDKLPQGLYTVIGAEGTYLSGGEKQRIVLARAILKNAPIVVLDEATAFTDPENEYLIRKALNNLTKGKTVLMIAHRLTTVQDADNIVVVANGKIDEQGTHQELLSNTGLYYNMWNEYQKSIAWKL